MSLALSYFLSCQGQIRSNVLIQLERKALEEQKRKEEEKLETQRFRNEYIRDVLYYNGLPPTKLAKFLISHFTLIHPQNKRAWLSLWCQNMYPNSYYASKSIHRRFICRKRKRTNP